jgi:hypothetical protein
VQRGDLVRLNHAELLDEDRYDLGMVINLGTTTDMNGIEQPLAWVRWCHPTIRWNMAHPYRVLEVLHAPR